MITTKIKHSQCFSNYNIIIKITPLFIRDTKWRINLLSIAWHVHHIVAPNQNENSSIPLAIMLIVIYGSYSLRHSGAALIFNAWKSVWYYFKLISRLRYFRYSGAALIFNAWKSESKILTMYNILLPIASLLPEQNEWSFCKLKLWLSGLSVG